MPALGFPRSSTPGHLPTEGQGRLVNAMPEASGSKWLYRRVPGLVAAMAAGYTGPRGFLDINGTIYAAFTGVAVRISPAGVVTLLGTLPGSDRVSWAQNNRAAPDGPNVAVVRSSGGPYLVDTVAGTIGAYPDTNLPVTVNSVSSLDGYLLFTDPAAGRMWASGLNDVWVSDSDHTQNALSFATAEARPDPIVRGFSISDVFYAMGSSTIEPWKDQGLSPFPLQRVPSVLPIGLLAPFAVAGFEEGWDHDPIFVAHDKTVHMLTGYTTQPISTPDVERFIRDSDTTTLEACVYTTAGHAFWCLSSNLGSWQFDVITKSWHERKSSGLARWRASCSVKSGGRWILGDTLSASLLAISETARDEVGSPLVFEVWSAALAEFPVRATLNALLANFALLDADASSDPQVAIAWSKNGGASFNAGVTRSLAAQPIRVNRLGLQSHQGFVVKLTVSAPVDFSFSGAAVGTPNLRAP